MSPIWAIASCTCAEITLRSIGSTARSLKAVMLSSALHALDVGAEGREFFLDPLEAAVEMIDAIDHGFTFGREPRDDQAHRSAQVRRHHRRAAQLFDAAH